MTGTTPGSGSRTPRNADEWIDSAEQWWGPYVLDADAATPAEKAEGLVDAVAYWHKVAEFQSADAQVKASVLIDVRACVDQMRLWEPDTSQHRSALRRLQEVIDDA